MRPHSDLHLFLGHQQYRYARLIERILIANIFYFDSLAARCRGFLGFLAALVARPLRFRRHQAEQRVISDF